MHAGSCERGKAVGQGVRRCHPSQMEWKTEDLSLPLLLQCGAAWDENSPND